MLPMPLDQYSNSNSNMKKRNQSDSLSSESSSSSSLSESFSFFLPSFIIFTLAAAFIVFLLGLLGLLVLPKAVAVDMGVGVVLGSEGGCGARVGLPLRIAEGLVVGVMGVACDAAADGLLEKGVLLSEGLARLIGRPVGVAVVRVGCPFGEPV